jgi:hypothetical protein
LPQSDLRLAIAGLRLRFTAEPPLSLGPLDAIHAPFTDSADDTGWRSMAIKVRRGQASVPEDALEIFDTGETWKLFRLGETLWYRNCPEAQGTTPFWVLEADNGFRELTVHCGEHLIEGPEDRPVVRHVAHYPLDQILTVNGLVRSQGLLLHAAGARIDNRGILFVGRSGAGKTTVTMLLENIEQAFEFMSDDRIALHTNDGRILAFGTPWPGDARIAVNISAPASALCFLTQAPRTALHELTTADAIKRLLPAASVPWYDRELVEAALDFCETLFAQVPAYELAFRGDGEGLMEALRPILLAV